MAGGDGRKWATIGAFFCPIAFGLLFLAMAGAPASYLATNAGAGGVVCLLIAVVSGRNAGGTLLFAIAGISLALLAASFAGPEIDGIHRWIAIGPVRLHAGLLILPALVAILPGLDRKAAFIVTAVTATLLALQPDRASAFALCASSLMRFALARDGWSLAAFAVSGAALGCTIAQPDALSPVPFVEGVIGDATAIHPLLSMAMVASILVAAIGPLLSLSRRISPGAAGFSVCLLAYFLASLVGHYPVPLLGYGTTSIFGFGLAIGLLTATDGAKHGEARL